MTGPEFYRFLLRLLPPDIEHAERDEIAATFDELLANAKTPARRIRVLLVSFSRLPLVAACEWKDHLSRSRARPRRKGHMMYRLRSVVRQGARSLSRSPTFTWSVVLLLGLGVGAVTTIFSVVDHVVLRPLPYPEADRLVKVEGSHAGPTFERLSHLDDVEAVAAVALEEVNMTGADQPARVREARVTRDFLAMFGARPALGRLLVSEDFGPDEAVVITHGTWQRFFGADSSVVGRTLRIDGSSRTVVGVLEPSFVPPEALEGRADVWRPIGPAAATFADENYYILSVALRLEEGVTLEQAQARADVVAAERARESPGRYLDDDGAPTRLSLVPLQEATSGGSRRGLLLMLAAVTVLLLVACVNVALLFIARGVERAREITVRRALGAGGAVIARQLAVQSVLLGLAGAGLGTAMAVAALRAFRALAPASLPRMGALTIDTRILAFAVVVGTLTALVFGLLPALRLALKTRENPLELASRGTDMTRGAHSAHQGLVVAEIALSLVLTAQAAWLIQGFADLHAVDLGFRTEGVWTAPLTLTGIERPEEFTQRAEEIRASIASVPGVVAASFGLTAPLEFTGANRCCWHALPGFPGQDERQRSTVMHPVDAGFFEVLELEVLAGSMWTRADAEAGGSPVVISEPLALDVFGSTGAAIGKSMTVASRAHTVVGVAADSRHYGPNHEHGFAAYIPISTLPFAPDRVTMVARVEGSQAGLSRALAAAVWRTEPDLAVPTIRSMEDWAAEATGPQRFLSVLFTVFGVVAVILMAGGLAGALLYNVRMRRRELGTRLALGATAGRLERSVVQRGLLLTAGGIVIGGMGAWAAGPIMDGIAPGMQARGAGAFAASVAVLLAVALLSSWLPAWRAGKADPIEVLRAE